MVPAEHESPSLSETLKAGLYVLCHPESDVSGGNWYQVFLPWFPGVKLKEFTRAI
jgi:hypothetical protein